MEEYSEYDVYEEAMSAVESENCGF